MAAGGLTCVGGTGEDYAMPGWNALLLQTDHPGEFAARFEPLVADPLERRRMRLRAVATARRFQWPTVVRRHLIPALGLAAAQEAGASAAWGLSP